MDIFKLLTIESVSAIGIVLAGFAAYVIALARGKIYTEGRHNDVVKLKDEQIKTLQESLGSCTGENKECRRDYQEARISIVRFEERDRLRELMRRDTP